MTGRAAAFAMPLHSSHWAVASGQPELKALVTGFLFFTFLCCLTGAKAQVPTPG